MASQTPSKPPSESLFSFSEALAAPEDSMNVDPHSNLGSSSTHLLFIKISNSSFLGEEFVSHDASLEEILRGPSADLASTSSADLRRTVCHMASCTIYSININYSFSLASEHLQSI